MSARRRRELKARATVRLIVARKANHRCQATHAPGRCDGDLEVHELRGGYFYREALWLFPAACRLVCQSHHRWITDNTKAAGELDPVLWWSEAQADEFLAGVGFVSKVVPRG